MNQTIYDSYSPVDKGGVDVLIPESEQLEAEASLANAINMSQEMVDLNFALMRERIEEISTPEVVEPATAPIPANPNRPYDWAVDGIGDEPTVPKTYDYKPSLFPKVYDWAVDGLEDDLLHDDTELFQFHVSDHEISTLEHPADEKGLFSGYTATGLTGKFLDNKPDISDKNQDAFFEFAHDKDYRKADMDVLLETKVSPLKIKARRALGAVALSASLLAGSLFGAASLGDNEPTLVKTETKEHVFLHEELAANSHPVVAQPAEAATPTNILPIETQPIPEPNYMNYTPAQNEALGKEIAVNEFSYSEQQLQCLDVLWTKESGWDHTANNPESSALGIPQGLVALHELGEDYSGPRTGGIQGRPATYEYKGGHPVVQIKWGLTYIKGKYTTACNALRKWTRATGY